MEKAVIERDRIWEGHDVAVDLMAIEKNLAELWRAESGDSDEAVIKAALWNVVAHTDNDDDRTRAAQVLGLASASVPQRTIVIRAQPNAEPELSSWISANCHLIGGSRQVCSEEIAIVAGGRRVEHVPSIVNALLIPDMPVAAWWIGDLPPAEYSYVAPLLDPVDRLIVDSYGFAGAGDLELVARITAGTNTMAADLNWVRLEEWRIATAAMFDSPEMRARLGDIRSVNVISRRTSERAFGEKVDALLYASWLMERLGRELTFAFSEGRQNAPSGCVEAVTVEFGKGGRVIIERQEDAHAIITRTEGLSAAPPSVTRYAPRELVDLIVRQLSRRDEDTVFPRVLPIAAQLARQI